MEIFKTSQFGEITYQEKDIIKTPKGIFGFGGYKKYVIIKKEEDLPFLWFQSIENPKLAFVITDPLIFFPTYKIIPDKSDLDELKVSDPKELKIYVIVTIPPKSSDLSSANLIAPLVINPRINLAKQLVLPRSPYTLKHYILETLKKKKTKK